MSVGLAAVIGLTIDVVDGQRILKVWLAKVKKEFGDT